MESGVVAARILSKGFIEVHTYIQSGRRNQNETVESVQSRINEHTATSVTGSAGIKVVLQ